MVRDKPNASTNISIALRKYFNNCSHFCFLYFSRSDWLKWRRKKFCRGRKIFCMLDRSDFFVLNFKIYFLSLDPFYRIKIFASSTLFLWEWFNWYLCNSTITDEDERGCSEQSTRSNRKIDFLRHLWMSTQILDQTTSSWWVLDVLSTYYTLLWNVDLSSHK